MSNAKGLFDLDIMDIFESTAGDDSSSGKKDVSIPVPGGDKETPTAKPYDASSIPVPAAKEIPLSAYQDALGKLQKSYKESAEVLEMLVQCVPVAESYEMSEEEFLENVAFSTIFNYYDNGEFFEAVDADNKSDAKAAIKKIRSKMSRHGIGKKYGLRQYWSVPEKMIVDVASYVPSASMSAAATAAGTGGTIAGISSFVGAIIGAAAGSAIATPINRWWIKLFRTNRSFTAKWWQMVGGFNVADDISEKKLKEILDEMREDYKEELGDFTFNVIRIMIPTKVLRWFITGTSKGYILVIDQKEKSIETINLNPSEKEINELKSLVEKGPKDKDDKKKSITESGKDKDDDDEDEKEKKKEEKCDCGKDDCKICCKDKK